MILREGMLLASLGLAIGLGLAAAVTRLVSSYLVEVSALDALTFGRRAAAIDPVRALKME
jgi:hypothetical protein